MVLQSARVAAAAVKSTVRTRVVQRACVCASHAQGECESCQKKQLQRRAAAPRHRSGKVDVSGCERGGQALDAPWRDRLEPLYGTSFADVRIHDDAASHRAARELDAHAFTVGQHIHFAAGRYRPAQRDGLHLLAHELTHTLQQQGVAAETPLRDGVEIDPADSPLERAADRIADLVTRSVSAPDRGARPVTPVSAGAPPARVVQRVSFGEFLSRLFFEGTFSEEELLRYVKYLDDHAAIEGDYDSDNKAREIIRRWRRGDERFRLTLQQKQLMLLELIDGPTLDDDEHAILELLRGSSDTDVRTLLATAGGESSLRDEFHGSENDELGVFLREWHQKPENRSEPAGDRAGRRAAIREIVVNQDTPQTVTVHYNDGRIEADTCSTGKGTCCVEPGTDTGPTPAETQQNDSNWTPKGDSHRVMFTQAEHGPGHIRWWTQFHWRAIALHEYTPVDGTPLSHGCVRLHAGIAQRIHEGAVPRRTVVRVIGSPRPRCDHGALVNEWRKDFAGGAAADGDPELRKHLEVSFGLRGPALDQKISQGVIPRCGGGRPARSGRGAR